MCLLGGKTFFSPSNESRKDPLDQFYPVLKLSTYFCTNITQKNDTSKSKVSSLSMITKSMWVN